eukprot:1842599-Pyramimonas_sp.AAC.1
MVAGRLKQLKEKDAVREKIQKAIGEVREKGERGNVYFNIARTGLSDKAHPQERISPGKVEDMASGISSR